jgi:NitT/TauT family transport system permease protein
MRIRGHVALIGPPLISLIGFLVLWQGATFVWAIPSWLLPSPSTILVAAWNWRQILLSDVAITLSETLLGFASALLIAVPLAALLVSSRFVWRALYPLLSGVQSIPKNALAPLLILWFGTGQTSKVIIAFLIAFFPIVINALTGMSQIDQDALDMVKSLRANTWQIFWYFRLPNALPYIFAASKVAITLALVGAVIGEFVGADSGLGYLILISSSQLQTDLAFVAIVLLALLGMVLFSLVGAIERQTIPWCTSGPDEPIAAVA